jgi:hypothetical protein
MRIDLGIVDERIKYGVTAQRAKAMDNHWTRWDAFCVAHNIDPYLRTWTDPVPILQVFGERYRDGRLGPSNSPSKFAQWRTPCVPWARHTPGWGP